MLSVDYFMKVTSRKNKCQIFISRRVYRLFYLCMMVNKQPIQSIETASQPYNTLELYKTLQARSQTI